MAANRFDESDMAIADRKALDMHIADVFREDRYLNKIALVTLPRDHEVHTLRDLLSIPEDRKCKLLTPVMRSRMNLYLKSWSHTPLRV